MGMLHGHLPTLPQGHRRTGRGEALQELHAAIRRIHRDGDVHATVPNQRLHGVLPRPLLRVKLPDRLHRHPHLLRHVLRPPHHLLARQVGLVPRRGRPSDRPAGDHRRRAPGQAEEGPCEDLLHYRINLYRVLLSESECGVFVSCAQVQTGPTEVSHNI